MASRPVAVDDLRVGMWVVLKACEGENFVWDAGEAWKKNRRVMRAPSYDSWDLLPRRIEAISLPYVVVRCMTSDVSMPRVWDIRKVQLAAPNRAFIRVFKEYIKWLNEEDDSDEHDASHAHGDLL